MQRGGVAALLPEGNEAAGLKTTHFDFEGAAMASQLAYLHRHANFSFGVTSLLDFKVRIVDCGWGLVVMVSMIRSKKRG